MISVSLLLPAALLAALQLLPLLAAFDDARLPGVLFWTGGEGLLVQAGVAAGAALAILLYYHRNIGLMAVGLYRKARRRDRDGARLVAMLFLANLPPLAGVVAVARLGAPAWLYSTQTLAALLLAGGLFLWFADRVGLTARRIEHLDAGGALLIGLFRAVALVPLLGGLSLAVAAARMLDYERPEAVRIAALAALPWLIGTAVVDYLARPGLNLDAVLAAIVGLLVGLAVLSLLSGWLKRHRFTPFALVQIVIGAILFWTIYG